MIYQFLRIIDQGGFQSQLDIARQMAISPAMVLQIAGDLARRGYLQMTNGACDPGSACSGCAASSACQTSFSLWTLTEKGRQAMVH